ncbi:MAG: hypothetical protein J0G36_01145 [Afipia sp.]|nr:hypothetical protein [Afipia sp.]
MRCRAFAMMAVLCAGLSAGLGACAARDPYVATPATTTSGNWKIEKQTDRITGAPVPSAMLIINNASNTFADYAQPASMQLTCFDGKPMVRFAFEFKVGTDPNSTLGYRFDEKPGHDNIAARFLQEYRTVVIEDRAAVTTFVNELAMSNMLVIRIRSLAAGRTTAEFKLDGAPAAIEAAFAGCPLTPATPAPPETRKKRRVARG